MLTGHVLQNYALEELKIEECLKKDLLFGNKSSIWSSLGCTNSMKLSKGYVIVFIAFS